MSAQVFNQLGQNPISLLVHFPHKAVVWDWILRGLPQSGSEEKEGPAATIMKCFWMFSVILLHLSSLHLLTSAPVHQNKTSKSFHSKIQSDKNIFLPLNFFYCAGFTVKTQQRNGACDVMAGPPEDWLAQTSAGSWPQMLLDWSLVLPGKRCGSPLISHNTDEHPGPETTPSIPFLWGRAQWAREW